MSMDHRWGMREPIERATLIACGSAKPLRGRSRDVSFSGIFVSVSQAALEHNAMLELVVTLRAGGITSIHRLPVAVARVSEHGVGLMFSALDPGEIIRFLTLLRDRDSFLVLRRPNRGRRRPHKPGRADAPGSVGGGDKTEAITVTTDTNPRQDG
jgi:PilZ domain